ncbi:MAG TPA: sulfite exporter TauE/SafE family protein [Ilumatobacteraceae bacterium]|nr:sulfite exporter TauE/SafE family protein [Ilumatobacteraceae bacterium]
MFGLSIGVALACVFVVFIGATVQASIGIGVGLIASPVLAMADPDFIPVAILLCILPLTFTVAWLDRRHIQRRQVGFALLGRVPGVVAGALIVAALSDRMLAVMVAVSVFIAVAASLTGRRFHPTDRSLMVAGLASGFAATTTGVGGPPMALTYQHSDPATMRSTISAFFLFGALMSVAALALAGEVGVRQWQLTALLMPPIALGVIAARLLQHRLDPSVVRPAVLVMCSVAALALLVETF